MPSPLTKLNLRALVASLPSIGWQVNQTKPLPVFASQFFERALPCHLHQSFSDDLPAMRRWFKPLDSAKAFVRLDHEYLLPYGAQAVSLERTGSEGKFERFTASFSLFIAYTSQKLEFPNSVSFSLYLAQQDLRDLPQALQDDLPTPELVLKAGKGDVYGSSIWLGIPPTRTPLHRDPNPNLFVQLAGRKIIRLLRPGDGRKIFFAAKEVALNGRPGLEAGQWGLNFRGETVWRGGSEGIRGDELMGDEGNIADEAVWGQPDDNTISDSNTFDVYEASLEPGDGLFIPKAWWHSVRGAGYGINASVNWWFR